MRQWNEIAPAYKQTTPLPGDIAIIDLGKGAGHVCVILEVNGDLVKTVEGNTNNNGSANGDGVYIRERKISKFIGFIRV